SELLSVHGAQITATYYCPETPDSAGADSCHKPALRMYQQASREHDIDLAASAYIGDKWRDVEPAIKMSGYGVLVPTAATSADDVERARLSAHIAQDIEQAVGNALAWMSGSH
ncbi:MAG: HAD hydrolase-like protein, partial [Gemmatimonadota bacterium]|nr:HAD hydrolase-like protein [Gemmatimonadota bacterium]